MRGYTKPINNEKSTINNQIGNENYTEVPSASSTSTAAEYLPNGALI